MVTEERSARGRELAEEALIKLALELDLHREELVIIGGLNPEFLTEEPPVAHQGTNDVDILLSVGFVYERDEMDFKWLEDALIISGFELDEVTTAGWRWRLDLHGARIKLELLCDVYGEQPHVIDLPGCDQVTVMNLQGPGAAFKDSQTRTLTVPEALGGGNVHLRFAGLGGYLMSKASAIVGRRLEKDFYDFAFVLLFNRAGGPRQAAIALKASSALDLLARYSTDVTAAINSFTDGERVGAVVYAQEMQRAGSETDFDILVEDAASAAAEFLDELRS